MNCVAIYIVAISTPLERKMSSAGNRSRNRVESEKHPTAARTEYRIQKKKQQQPPPHRIPK